MLVNADTFDDAGVYKLTDDLALALTIDLITPIVDDPYQFGAIAAANSLSDIYAMGAHPITALNIVCFPDKALPTWVLGEILRGGGEKAMEAGVPIIGGHSVKDNEPKYGMAAVGVLHPQKILKNSGMQPGDILLLTKPIGTGLVTTAAKMGFCPEPVLEEAIRWMMTLNNKGAEVALRYGAHAGTDITGFGLLGHLREMLLGSHQAARIYLGRVPLLQGLRPLVKKRSIPGGTYDVLEALEGLAHWDRSISKEDQLILCDPQTSGGLLLSLPGDRADAALAELRQAGLPAALIGEVLDLRSPLLEIAP